MSCGSERQERRRVYSEEALDSVRLKNSRAGHLSRVTALFRATDVLLNNSRNVNEVAEKLLEIDEVFARFEKAYYDYFATLQSENLEEWESEARYFKEHCNRKLNFVSRIERWIRKASMETHEDEIYPEDSISAMGSNRGHGCSHLSIRQLKGKQALAHLKLKQLEQRQELLRQEEDTKLRLESLETRYEILRTDLELKLLQDEDIVYADLPDVFEELNPFNLGVNAGVVKAPCKAGIFYASSGTEN